MTGVLAPGAPSQGQVQVWAALYVDAWLRKDFWACAQLAEAIDRADLTAGRAMEVATLVAASMLAEALGSAAQAASYAGRRAAAEAAREARLLSASS